MSGVDLMSREQVAAMEQRLRTLAREKSYLQLVIDLLTRLGEVPGLERTTESILRILLDTLGGSNVTLYYWVGARLFSVNVYGDRRTLARMDDPLVEEAFKRLEFVEEIRDFTDTRMTTPAFTKSSYWALPLMVNDSLVGILKMEGMLIGAAEIREQLEPFFSYAALVLKNEVEGHLRLMEATQLAAIVQSSDDAVFSVTPEGLVATWNQGAERVYGYTESEIVGAPVSLLVPAEQASDVEAILSRLRAGEHIQRYEVTRRRKDGREIIVSLTICPVLDAGGKLVGISSIARDVTAQKIAEAEVLRLNRVYRLLSRVNKTIVNRGDEGSLLDEICRISVMEGGFCAARIAFLEDEGRTCRVKAAALGATVGVAAWEGFRCGDVLPEHSAEQAALAEGRTVTCGCASAKEPGDASCPPSHVSHAVIPLRMDGGIFGTWLFCAREPDPFDPREVALLEEMAADVGFAIRSIRVAERTRLAEARVKASEARFRGLFEDSPVPIWEEDFSEVHALLERLKTEGVTDIEHEFVRRPALLEEAVGAVRVIDANRAAVALHRAESKDVLLLGLAQTFTPESLDTFRSELVTMWQGKTWMVRDSAVRTLAGERREVCVYWTVNHGHEADYSSVLVSLVDVTERRRAEQELRRMNRELRAITECNETLLRAVDEQTLLEEVCRIVCEVAGYRMAWAGYVEHDEARTIRPAAWAGEEAGYIESVRLTWSAEDEFGRGPAGETVRTGRPVYIQDLATESVAAPWRTQALERGYRSGIALPLKGEGGAVFGLLAIYSGEPQAFTPGELRLLEELSEDIAYGITAIRARLERRKTETALRNSQAELGAVYEHAPIVMGLFDENMRLLRANEVAADLAGRVPEMLVGMPVGGVVGCARADPVSGCCSDRPECCECLLRQAMEDSLNTGSAHPGIETTLRLARGDESRSIIVNVHTSRLEIEGRPRVLLCLQDVTARRLSEDALRESELRFRQVTESIEEVFWLTDTGKREMIYVSPAYEEIWGRSLASLYAEPLSWLEAVHPEDRERVRSAVPAQASGTYDIEFRILRPDGEPRWIHDRAFPIREANGLVYRVAGVAEDVTERRQLEEQFRQAQKMEAIGQLAGGVAHDFNNLLTVIQMQGSFLLEDAGCTPDTQAGLRQIMAAAERAANLTRQLLTFSRRRTKRAKAVNLGEIVAGTTQMLRRLLGEQVELETRIAPDLPLVDADAGMMEQVLMNLAINARDALPNGGRIEVALDTRVLEAAELASKPVMQAGRYLRLAVSDNGCGIPAENMPRIFEPFFTTKEVGKGTGLGLATVFGIVQQHHGWIDVESEVEKGSRFEVYVPAMVTAPVQRNGAQPAAMKGGTESILLVEDDESVRSLAEAILARWGYRVIPASNAAEALRCWEEQKENVDLVVTDMVMPGGMSGRGLVDELRKRRAGVKAVFTSGYSEEGARQDPLSEYGRYFLPKPYAVEELLKIIRRRLDER